MHVMRDGDTGIVIMRVLVTGGAGFIGSHLVEELHARGNEVVVLDDLSTGRAANLENVRDEIELLNASVLDQDAVADAAEGADRIFHLAAAVGVKLIIEQPLRSLLTNVRGTENVLAVAATTGAKTLITSTSEIYGKSPDVPFAEDDDRLLGNPRISRWAYSTSKAVDEILAYAYYGDLGLPTVVARLFNTVGPRQTGGSGMVLPRFAAQALAGEELTVYGTGEQTRCFCHVKDVAAALLGLMDSDRAVGEVFNVGSEEETSIADLARRVIAVGGSSSTIGFSTYVEAYGESFEDMPRRVPDISKIRSLTGWEPRITLDEIIEEIVSQQRLVSTP